ncbi:10992_t:CDS:2, partial [Racocetra persica]
DVTPSSYALASMSSQPLLQSKRIAIPVRVEPKFTVILGGLAIGLLNFGDRVGRISAALFTAVGTQNITTMLVMMYALLIYHWRAAKIRVKEPGPYDDRYGPTFLCIFLIVTSDTSPTATNPSENAQLIEELKKPRRVLKTHRKSIDDTKGVSSTDLPPPSLMTTVVDEEDDSITTDSLK